jgi:ComF family protein
VSAIEKVLNIYAPSSCVGCGRQGSNLCSGCMADVPVNRFSRCFSCAKWSSDFSTCKKCRRRTPLRNVWVAAEYSGNIKELIHQFKYERNRAAAKTLADLVASRLPYTGDINVITHVPTATSRVRARGYDHSKLLARELSNKLNIKHRTLLGRLGQSQQMGSKRKDRLSQAEGSYIAVKQAPSSVLLVDDVLTTGATLNAAAKELKRGAAKHIYAVVVAHNSS